MDANHTSWQELSILHYVAAKGDIDMAALLISHGADLDLIDDEFLSTPLGVASRFGQTEMVRLLLHSGGDPLKAGAEWAIPVQWARSRGHHDIVEILEKGIS